MKQKKERPIDRIKALADWLIANKVIKTLTKFEEVCGLSRHYVKNLMQTEKGNPGVDTLAAIYEVFPSVSLKWLVVGKGPMFTSRNETELIERMKLDMISHEVLAVTTGNKDLKDALKKALVEHKDDLTADEKIALLERLL